MKVAIDLLGRRVPVLLQELVPAELWQAVIRHRLAGFRDAANAAAGRLSYEQKRVFGLIESVAVFARVRHGGWTMTRSFVDEPSRRFFWAADDLASPGYAAAERIPCFYFHDAWHVRQWLAGERYPGLEARIDREVEASLRQLEVARASGADAGFLAWLAAYAGDREAIARRMEGGAEPSAEADGSLHALGDAELGLRDPPSPLPGCDG